MLTKKKRKQQEFIKLLTKAYSYIKIKKFSDAVALYNKVNELYKKLSEEDRTDKIKQDIQRLHKELSLYLRINEAYVLSEKGDLARLKNELDSIHSSLYELDNTEETKPLLNYVENHYNFFLDIYSYKTSEDHFNKKRAEVRKNIEASKLSEAKRNYSQLLVIFNQLSNFIDEYEKERLYASLKELFKEISIKEMVSGATSKPTKIKPKKVALKKLEDYKHPVLKSNAYSFDGEYAELRGLLKKGDASKAEKKLSGL